MSFQVSGQVQKGVFPNVASGTSSQPFTQGQFGEAMVSELNGRYANLALAGQIFAAANTAQQALSLTGTTTYTGLVVSNPAGSGKNLVMLDVLFSLGTLQTGLGAIVLFQGTSVALTTGNSTGPNGTPLLLGSGTATVAKVGASATLAANPNVIRSLAGTQWVTTGTTSNIQIVKDELAGIIVVPPGQLIGIVAVTTAVSGIASFTWAELPL